MKANLDPAPEALTEKIIGAAFAVSNVLGHGFLESVYKNALVEELSSKGAVVAKERPFAIHYNGKQVGLYVADVVVGDRVVVELKAVSALAQPHSAQLLNYLKAARLGVGLLLNFGVPRIEVKRIINGSFFDGSYAKRMKEDISG